MKVDMSNANEENNKIMLRLFKDKQIICPIGEPNFDVVLKRSVRQALDAKDAELSTTKELLLETQTNRNAAWERVKELEKELTVAEARLFGLDKKDDNAPHIYSDSNNHAYFDSGFYFKDSEGVVWQVIKTPYKEIPIVNITSPKQGN